MKWPGEDPNLINLTNQQTAHGHNPPRTQDDAMIGYVFQRGTGDQPEFPPTNVPFPGKIPARWTLGSEELVQHQQQHPNQEMIYMNSEMAMMTQHHPGLALPPHMQPRPIAPSAKKLWGVEEQRDDKGLLHLSEHQMWRDSTWSIADHAVSQPISMVPRRSGSFPGSDTANMLSPRSSDTGGLGVKMVEYVLATSPTNKDHLESRMRNLVLNSNDGDKKEKELNKNSSSPYEAKKDDVNGNAAQTNGHASNGLSDDEKTFNRTPGSRQPSPAEEEINKNNGGNIALQPAAIMAHKAAQMEQLHMMGHMNGLHPVLALQAQQQTLQNGNLLPGPPPVPPHDSINQHFAEHAVHATLDQNFDPTSYASGIGNGTQAVLAGTSGGMDSPGVLPQNLDIQTSPPLPAVGLYDLEKSSSGKMVNKRFINLHSWLGPVCVKQMKESMQLFRNQQQQQQQPQQSGTSQPIHVLQQQQQQYLQQQAAAAQQQQLAFNTAPYVINAQEPYILAAGPTVLPQYYGVAPWGVYPASIIQQNAAGQQRRPLSPGSAAAAAAAATSDTTNLAQGQYIIPYYDQNGSIVMGNVRSIGNTAPMRLVSPAPVLVNAATTGTGMRLLGNQPQPIATPPTPATLYNTSQPSVYSSTATVNGNLGLSSTSGRRDSFDRNISAFSPSLDYNRGKWNTSYGALGTVTAAPSPLGLTGSLTPPPSLTATLGSSSNLQLGALMSNRVLSAAPGAEAVAKYRNGLTTAAMFGSSSSLLTKLTAAASRPGAVDKQAGRSRLLEDFRNNRFPSLSLRDLGCHIVEFSQDQHGSRFIQQKLERATVNEKQMVFNEILPSAYNLMTDVFGNYVIQKFFEFGTPEQKATLAQKVRGHVLLLALQMYGCRVIQKALESVTPEQQQEIVRELDGHVLKCVKDQNGNHVVQKCIECVDPHALQFIINAFSGQVFALSTHPYGCRVIQRILEHCTPEQTAPILEELHSHAEQLVQDQYGNYVIQHVLEHGKQEDKSKIINNVRGKVLALSQHKFASNVVEKCVTHATRAERSVLIEEVCNFNDNALQVMMRDQYANYVVQKMIDVCEHGQRKVLMHKIRGHISALRKYTYGKHIIAKLDKFFMKTPTLPSVGSELL